jgi:hypothetical protein
MTPMMAYLLVKARQRESRAEPSTPGAGLAPAGRSIRREGYRRFRLWLGIGGAVTEGVLPVLSTALSRHVTPVPDPVPDRSTWVAGQRAARPALGPTLPARGAARPMLPASRPAVIGCRA